MMWYIQPRRPNKTIENVLKEVLEIKAEIMSSVKLGEIICLIELTNQTMNTMIMKNNKLRMRSGEKLFVQDDLAKKDMEIQKQIRAKKGKMEK